MFLFKSFVIKKKNVQAFLNSYSRQQTDLLDLAMSISSHNSKGDIC